MSAYKSPTLSVAQFRAVSARAVYYPHPAVAKGLLSCTGAAGTEDHSDTRVLIDHRARLDLTADIRLGAWVMISNGVHIYTHTNDLTGRQPLLLKSVLQADTFTTLVPKSIGDDVWLFSSIILAHCQEIARGVVVGAGSVVTKNITEEYSIWAGNPARKIGMR